MTIYDRIKYKRLELKMSQQELADKTGYKTRSAINKIENGLRDIGQKKIKQFANALDVTPAYLMGWEEENKTTSDTFNFPEPNVTDKYSAIPVIGEIAAGYEHIAFESWEGETVDIPDSYLIGHDKSDFFVLKVVGDSMFPEYRDGDKVLILKQSTLNYSGQVGAIIYNNECATLKKVEYSNGEDWLKLVPINPNYPTVKIENEDLEQCRVIGIPRLLIREIEE